MMAVDLPCVCPSRHWLTSCSEVYWQLCSTWDSLPGAYHKLVMRSVQAALGELLRGGPDTASGVPATMVPTPYDADALATHLAGDAESPVAEEDPETAEAMADPAAAAEAKEDAEAAAAAEAEETAAAEAAEAGGDVSFHSGRAFPIRLLMGILISRCLLPLRRYPRTATNLTRVQSTRFRILTTSLGGWRLEAVLAGGWCTIPAVAFRALTVVNRRRPDRVRS
jgi:hypothetical protein